MLLLLVGAYGSCVCWEKNGIQRVKNEYNVNKIYNQLEIKVIE